MQSFERGVSEHTFGIAEGETCAACGMKLALPGLVADGRRFCCQGCIGAPGSAGELRPPRHHQIQTVRAVKVDIAPEKVGDFLADIKLLHLYEQKLDRIQVSAVSSDGRRACATAIGRFALVNYHIELHFDAYRGGGYKSTLCANGPIAGLNGSFAVKPADDGTSIVTHVETYEFLGGAAGWSLGTLVRPYIGWSMARELRTLKRLVEEPAALADAIRRTDPRTIPIDPAVVVWDPRHPDAGHRALLPRVPTPETVSLVGAFGLGALLGSVVSRRR